MSARIVEFPQPVTGTDVTILDEKDGQLRLKVPGPYGRRVTVHAKAPAGVSLDELKRASADNRLRFDGPPWHYTVRIIGAWS